MLTLVGSDKGAISHVKSGIADQGSCKKAENLHLMMSTARAYPEAQTLRAWSRHRQLGMVPQLLDETPPIL